MTSDNDDFWGGSADWPTAQHPLQSGPTDDAPRDPSGATPRTRITGRHRLSGFLDRGTAPTREHRVVDASAGGHADRGAAAASASDYSYDDPDATFDWEIAEPPAAEHAAPSTARAHPDDDVEWGAEWDVAEPRTRAAMIDPLLARIGAVVVAVTLAVPLILGLRSDNGLGDAVREAEAEAAVPSSVLAADDLPVTPDSVASNAAASADDASTAGSAATVAPSSQSATTASAGSSASSSTASSSTAGESSDDALVVSALDEAPTDEAVATDACATEYDVVAGDFWLRLAEGADVPLADLLAVNGASSDTALFPGSTICLPAGASTPPPPPVTTAAPTTAAPTTAAPTTAAPTTAAPTTAAPTTAAPTTAAPTTAAPATNPPVASGTVEEIIRAVWPDELEEKALDIAWRESNHRPDVRNYCCIGLFQIYWEVHQGWLSDMGVTTLDHLYDAETNARAAYALYQRAGGWGPWGG